MHGYQFGMHGYPRERPAAAGRAGLVERGRGSSATGSAARPAGGSRCRPRPSGNTPAAPARRRPFCYGDLDADFSKFANLGDAKLREFALDTYVQVRLVPEPEPYDDWVPKDERFNDGGFVSVDVGRYRPNPWGLYDMHGNVWEWTRSVYRPYPYRSDDGRNEPGTAGRRVVRGGSWYDRPKRCRSAFRLAYEPYQRVFNVGFRVVMEE